MNTLVQVLAIVGVISIGIFVVWYVSMLIEEWRDGILKEVFSDLSERNFNLNRDLLDIKELFSRTQSTWQSKFDLLQNRVAVVEQDAVLRKDVAQTFNDFYTRLEKLAVRIGDLEAKDANKKKNPRP